MNILGIIASSMKGVSGAYESIATFNPTSGTTVTFSSIPSTYKNLQLRYTFKATGAGGILKLGFNGDTGTNYSRHVLYGDGSAVVADGSSSVTSIYVSPNTGGSSTRNAVGIIDVHDYASTTKNKTARIFTGLDTNGAGTVDLWSGSWMNTAAVTSLEIVGLSITFAAGTTFSLYGIKG